MPAPLWWARAWAEAHPSFAPAARGSVCQLVVETGHSATTITPLLNGRVLAPAVRRVDVGGHLLTNYLKEVLSYRQLNLMDDGRTVETAKEALGVVSLDFDRDMRAPLRQRNGGSVGSLSSRRGGAGGNRVELACVTTLSPTAATAAAAATAGPRASTGADVAAPSVVALYDEDAEAATVRVPLRREFVLPDFSRVLHGFVRPLPAEAAAAAAARGETGFDASAAAAAAAAAAAEEQALVIENERIAIPELVFRPSDIGLRQVSRARDLRV